MADTRHKIEQTNRQGHLNDEMCLMTPSEMRQIVGARCWDGPLGDRRECPPKPPRGGGYEILGFINTD